MLAHAEPLELTPCCTVPQDKEDTAQANAQWALSLFMKSPSEGANECIHLARVRQHITLMARSVPLRHVWT